MVKTKSGISSAFIQNAPKLYFLVKINSTIPLFFLRHIFSSHFLLALMLSNVSGVCVF